jgi:hypothetical protein
MAVLISDGGSVPHASSNTNFAEKLVRFLTGTGYSSFTGTGGVRVRYTTAKPGAVDETWTLVCTNAGTGEFSVTGSVSGAQAAATVGTPYDNGLVAFVLTNIAAPPVLADQVQFNSYAGTLVEDDVAWDLIKMTVPVADQTHVFLRGKGAAGTDQIYVNLNTYQNVSADRYNLSFSGATGYVETTQDVAAQPGVSPKSDICLSNGSMPFWIIANGRRFHLVVKVSTVYESAYCGFILPTGIPSEFPYPLLIGGSQRDLDQRWSATGDAHRAFFNSGGACRMRDKGGAWLQVQNFGTPQSETSTTPFRDIRFHSNIDGTYTLYPVSIHTIVPAIGVLGDFDGIFMCSGIANPAENVVQIDGVNHLVVPNTYRSDPWDYAAFRLE